MHQIDTTITIVTEEMIEQSEKIHFMKDFFLHFPILVCYYNALKKLYNAFPNDYIILNENIK